MNIRRLALPVVMLLFVASAGTAMAEMYQEQSQKSSQSYSFSSNCEGDSCSSSEVHFKSKSKFKQSQSQSYGKSNSKWNSNHYSRNKNGWPRYGTASISWDQRGGTCHIRYSESNVHGYKYFTAAACDEGHSTIGGLQPGTSYRFQVRKDNEDWSPPQWMRAY